ncbi:hypothetical protein ALC53_10902 [Atta colombica]|uniref:Uncharacterized protein n=1 Tax=Atta colombica TaxID=520822 RepID=A0A151I034_9HYME|nr:hypothetical protein ALC53_10902 [Atta colombica]
MIRSVDSRSLENQCKKVTYEQPFECITNPRVFEHHTWRFTNGSRLCACRLGFGVLLRVVCKVRI